MSYQYDLDGNKSNILLACAKVFILPLITCVCSLYTKICITDDIDTVLTVVSVFTALIFGTIFIAPDRLMQRIDILKDNKGDEVTDNYIIRFTSFAKRFVRRISLIILVGLLLILLLLTQKIVKLNVLLAILNIMNIFLLMLLVVITLSVLADIYKLLMDDMEISNDIYNK